MSKQIIKKLTNTKKNLAIQKFCPIIKGGGKIKTDRDIFGN